MLIHLGDFLIIAIARFNSLHPCRHVLVTYQIRNTYRDDINDVKFDILKTDVKRGDAESCSRSFTMKLILLISLILSVCHNSKANEALVIGGFGATTYLQVVTKDGVCRGEVGFRGRF